MCLYPKGIRAEQKPNGNWISWARYAQKPTGSLEQCAQKQIKPLRGPAPWGGFIFF